MGTSRYFLWFAAVLVVLPLVGWGLVRRGENHSEYCAVCACEHLTQSWGVAGYGRALWTRDAINDTPVSTVLAAKKLVAPHTHRWVEPCLASNPLNPYTAPVRLSLGFVNTPLVAALLGNVGDYADPQSARHVCEVVLAPEYSYLINHDLRFHKFPPHGFRDRRQFLGWWQQNAFSFFDHLRDETVPD